MYMHIYIYVANVASDANLNTDLDVCVCVWESRRLGGGRRTKDMCFVMWFSCDVMIDLYLGKNSLQNL